MKISLARNWWSLIIRGAVAIIVGLVTFAWPAITFGAMVLLFGAYAFVDGIFALIGAFRAIRSNDRWGVLVFEGTAGIVTAAITVFWPAITALALVYIIAAWAFVTGALEIYAAIRLREYISGELLLVLGGIVSIIFGVVAVVLPVAGALAIALVFGVYAVMFGVILVALGLRLRGWMKATDAGAGMPVPAH